VVFILRPIGVFLSTGKDSLSWREKLFISWVGPRGIVAAGIASLFGLKLAKNGVEGAEYITPLVFMIVLGTVLLNATTARLVAAGLKVLKSVSDGILIVGASGPARIIAQYLHEEGRNVVLIDKNESNVKQCAQMGLQAINADIFTDNLEDNIDLVDMGYLVAMTGSADVNQYAATKYESEFGENGTYRLLTSEEMRNDSIEIPESGLLSYTDDFINLSEVVRDYPHINEIELKDKSQLNDLLEELNTIKESIPILIKQVDGNIEFLPGSLENLEVEEGTKLIYLGKEVELEDEA
jgi:hypothetical protein